MKIIFKRFIAVAITAMVVSACQPGQGPSWMTKENVGAATGAVGGAWIGSNVGKGKGNIAAIAAGTLLGGYLGKEVGASLDRADMAYYNRTSQNALESAPVGSTSTWQNPDSGNKGTFTPTKTFKTEQGTYCREYQQTVTIDGKTQQAYGQACRQPDGTWQIKK